MNDMPNCCSTINGNDVIYDVIWKLNVNAMLPTSAVDRGPPPSTAITLAVYSSGQRQ